MKEKKEEKMNTNKEDNLNESMTVVGIEMQSSALEASTVTNESESNLTSIVEYQNLVPSTSSATTTNTPNSAITPEVKDEDTTESIDMNSGDDEGIGDIMDEEIEGNGQRLDGFQLINLQPEIKVAVADEIIIPSEASEVDDEADTLSPLVMDNHVYVEHCEMMKHRNREIPGLYDHFEDDEEEEEEYDADDVEMSLGSTSSPSSSPLKQQAMTSHIKKDSISSDSGDDLVTSTKSSQINKDQQERRSSSTSEDNKDSGCDAKINKASSSDEELPIEIPDDEFCEKIVEQVEYYFSDESLLRDAFLLKHVRRNKEGFVSLKLVSSFKRVRALTKDWRVVGIAIKRKSKQIELNDVETKIRRVDPLPLYDETMPSRTVVATNLPFEKLTIEKVSDIFSKCGEIALVRILRPNAPIPADVRQFVNKHPELQQNECALVEFTESSSARRAQNMDGIIVFELVLPKKKTGKKATNMTKMIENFKYNSESENERSRGGENLNANRFYLKRNNSAGHFIRPEYQQQQQQQSPSPRKMSLGENNPSAIYTPPFNNFYPQQQQYYEIPQRRMSNTCLSPIQTPTERKFSDGYTSGYENSPRRQSMCSDVQRRLSSVGNEVVTMQPPSSPQSRRSSIGCIEYCSCGNSSRRSSSQFSSNDSYRRFSNASMNDFSRRFSNASSNGFERKFSNTSIASSAGHQCDSRRVSFDRKNSLNNIERKYSSNGFDPMRKLSSTSGDYYINGRKISTDSGYDRRLSINSITYDNENPITRSRNNSLVHSSPCQNHNNSPNNGEPLIRKPLGPDPDSRGFGFNRTRKIGLVGGGSVIISP